MPKSSPTDTWTPRRWVLQSPREQVSPLARATASDDNRRMLTGSFLSGGSRFARAVGVRATCLLWVVLAIGCGGPIRQLYPLGGDEFTLFPAERRSPPPLDCTGTDEQRFACLAKQAERMSQEQDVAGAFAVVTPDGNVRALALGDTLNRGVPVSADTPFPVGSVSKMFLAAAAVSLSLEGALDLERPIARYLPELSLTRGVGQATLHQLLTHSAGLGNPPQCQKAEDDLAELLTRYGQQPLWVAPGVLMNYSNLGYSFVALVLERVTGKPFEQVVRERVLTPAGLANGIFGPDLAVVRGHRAGPIVPRCRALWPSGGLLLSVRELAHWAHVMARPEASPLGRPLIELLTLPHVALGERPGATYGYGVVRFEHGGLQILHHSGRLEDFTAFVAWSPERQLGVAALANTGAMFVMPAGFRALSTFLSLSPDWQAPQVPAHPLAAYTGIYRDEVGTLGRLRVSLEGEQLVIDYLDGPPPLLPPGFRFAFEPGATRARYVVSPVGVGQRVSD
jgi:beta-lactamase class C